VGEREVVRKGRKEGAEERDDSSTHLCRGARNRRKNGQRKEETVVVVVVVCVRRRLGVVACLWRKEEKEGAKEGRRELMRSSQCGHTHAAAHRLDQGLHVLPKPV
jgi:hypothetical protein